MTTKKQGDEIDDQYPDLSDFDSDSLQHDGQQKKGDKNNGEKQGDQLMRIEQMMDRWRSQIQKKMVELQSDALIELNRQEIEKQL